MAFVRITLLAGIASVGADISADANSFLASVGLSKQSLLDMVKEAGAGSGWQFDVGEEHIQALQLDLENTFRAMPKNAEGKLDLMTLRYVMHRYFVENNGWFVHGVDPAGARFNASSPVDVLIGHVPDSVHAILEQRLAEGGFGQADVATIVAVVEDMIQRESTSKLQSLYTMWEMPFSENSTIDTGKVDKLMASYLSGHILGQNFSSLTRRQLALQSMQIKQVYPPWPLSLEFMRSVRARHHNDEGTGMSFSQVQATLFEIERNWNREVNNKQCGLIKGYLLDLNDHGTGCVKLSSFYDAMLHKDIWQFSESPQYMRESGLLDESNPANPKVIMANYINSPGNCVSDMGLFSICCLSECEEKLAHFEQHLQAPEATPREIATVARSVPSDFSPTNYSLPQSLERRLEEISTRGKVVLHGRLFAQWLHHAYPRQCPFPHMTGRTTYFRPWSYEAKTGNSLIVSDDEAYSFSESARSPVTENTNGTCAPWEAEEELFVHPAHSHYLQSLENEKAVWAGMYCVAALTGFASVALVLLQTGRTLLHAMKAHGAKEKPIIAKPITV